MPHVSFANPPQDRESLWWLVRVLFDVTIPRTRVCPDHCSPFDAFADAYFGICTIGQGEPYEFSRGIWHASRGLAGKSKTLSILGLTFAYTRGADITILGGSMAQSTNVHEYMVKGIESENLPDDMAMDVTATRIQLTNKGRVRPLPASQRNVRGPHPSVLLCDEVDEMELDIYDAALGQPMPQPNYLGQIVDTMTILSSTWQNADGTLTEIFRRAEEQEPVNDQGDAKTPIYRWCAAGNRTSSVITRRGQVWVEDVTTDDEVLTRGGWRPVQHSTFMGEKRVVVVNTDDGRALRVTPDHKILTANRGWVEAGLLGDRDSVVVVHAATTPTSPIAVGGEVTPGIGVPVGAFGGVAVTGGESATARVDATINRLEVGDADASRPKAQVVEGGLGDLPHQQAPHQSVHELLAPGVVLADLAVAGTHAPSRPDEARLDEPLDEAGGIDEVSVEPLGVELMGAGDAVTGVATLGGLEDGLPAIYTVHVTSVTLGVIMPVHDIGVHGDLHEFTVNGVVVANCYKENKIENNPYVDGKPTGWLTQKTIQEKIDSVSAEMFRIEYDLGEPSIGNRAIDTDLLDKCFIDTLPDGTPFEPIDELHRKDWDEWRFADPAVGATYVCGIDWAKEDDKTVITVARTDLPKRRLVYAARINRTNYPRMVSLANREIVRYDVGRNGVWHDSTGIGAVVNDYLDVRARAFTMTGDKRTTLLSNSINAIEKVTWEFPKMLRIFYTKLKFCSTGDLYHQGKDFHLPDELCSIALAEHAASRVISSAAPIVVGNSSTPSKLARSFQHESEARTEQQATVAMGRPINLVL